MNDLHPAPMLGIIGGSGIYEIDGLENVDWRKIESPWGEASDELLFGSLNGVKMVFPREPKSHFPVQIVGAFGLDVVEVSSGNCKTHGQKFRAKFFQ